SLARLSLSHLSRAARWPAGTSRSRRGVKVRTPGRRVDDGPTVSRPEVERPDRARLGRGAGSPPPAPAAPAPATGARGMAESEREVAVRNNVTARRRGTRRVRSRTGDRL